MTGVFDLDPFLFELHLLECSNSSGNAWGLSDSWISCADLAALENWEKSFFLSSRH